MHDTVMERRSDIFPGRDGGNQMITGKESLTGALVEALTMEKGTKEFYEYAAKKAKEQSFRNMFVRLRDWEDNHMKYIEFLYLGIQGDTDLESYEQFMRHVPATHIESGIPVGEAEKLFEKRTFTADAGIITFALEIEGKAYNLYRKLSQSAEDSNARVIFGEMKTQEQKHIDFLMDMKKELKS
jgi:rubrerythrin